MTGRPAATAPSSPPAPAGAVTPGWVARVVRPRARTWLVGAVFLAVTMALPGLLDEGQLSVYVLMGLAVMAVTGVSLLMGYAGQVSLGQAAFYAVGAYTAALPAVHGWPPLVGLLAAPLVAGAVAALVGTPLLRLHGHYLAFATLALQLIILSVAAEFDVLGGAIGLQGIPQLEVGGWVAEGARDYAWVTWGVVALTLVITANIVASRPGRGLRALAGSEAAAASVGVPVTRYKVVVFAISAAFAGAAGGIYAFFLGYIAPGSFTVAISVEWVVMAVVGGMGTRWGPVVGAVSITLVVQILNDVSTRPGMPSYAPTVLGYAAYAILLVAVLLLMPQGVGPWLRDRWRRFRHPHPTLPTTGVTAHGAEPGHRTGPDPDPDTRSDEPAPRASGVGG